ncbi:MAG: GMC family oxidoreductase N-terminal domain-containing protein [Patulibacter sp.]|nr:GMC family oxidoreductase N-terminal domain-containing protein [Patulibacter sp.]
MLPSAADYVIVGAGSAGCVLANRLTEDPGTSVVLIEAGGKDSGLNVRIPLAFPNLFHGPLDWNYETDPEPACHDRRLYVPRGKCLGGSSAMNAMLYVRGRPSDYDGWADDGATGWGWADVKPYFLKAESNSRGASDDHGADGPLHVQDAKSPRALNRRIVDGFVASGVDRNPDYNGPRQDGAGMFQVLQRDGRRWSAADAYLHPVRKRPNLSVVTHGQVERVEHDGDRATGVRYRDRKGELHVIRANREVLLSAGAIGSPQLLMLSGIGAAGKLRQHGITPLHDLSAVGQNLQDHPMLTVLWAVSETDTLYGADKPRRLLEWLLRRSGPLTSTAAESVAFWRSRPELPAADIQFHCGALFYEKHGAETYDGHAMTIAPVLLTPKSRGRVTLRSPHADDAPSILTNTLHEREDVDAMVAAIRMARRVAASGPLRATVERELRPGSEHESDEQLEASLRDRIELIYHPVGTCRMGAADDPNAVVDPELRVRGIDGLRVIDASVFPTIPGGNTHAPTVMVAERAADLLRGRTPLHDASVTTGVGA